MKIHIDKKQTKEKKGLFSSVDVTTIDFRYELNEDERAIVEKHPDIRKIKPIPYVHGGLDLSPSVNQMIEKGWRFVAYNSSELIEYENSIQQAAKQLKAHIESLQGSTGSTVIEI